MSLAMKTITITVAVLILVFLGWWGFKILTKPKPVGQIIGKVISVNGDNVTINQSDGSEISITAQGLSTGENVNIAVYKSKLTGKTEYRFYKKYSVGVAGK